LKGDPKTPLALRGVLDIGATSGDRVVLFTYAEKAATVETEATNGG
jgi:hypothetical protein